MKVSVIIVSYNTCALLRDCLRSVVELTDGVEYEILVADNGSQDGSCGMVREEFPGVLLIETGENLGFGKANNLAARQAGGEYLFFLNPDTVLLNNAIALLAGYLDEHPEAGVVGGNLYDEAGAPAQSFSPLHGVGWELTRLMPNFIKRRVWPPQTWFNYGEQSREVGYITGADLMVRRSALAGGEPFDPDFFMYYEDMEICERVRRESGLRIVSVPQARIAHLGGRSCTVSRRKFEMLSESKYPYYGKVHSRGYAGLVYRLTQTGYLAHRILGRLSGKKSKTEEYGMYAEANRKAWKYFKSRE